MSLHYFCPSYENYETEFCDNYNLASSIWSNSHEDRREVKSPLGEATKTKIWEWRACQDEFVAFLLSV